MKITVTAQALDRQEGDLSVDVLQHAICRTHKGFAGYLDACVAGMRVQIVGRFDCPWQGEEENDPHSYITQEVWIDGELVKLDIESGDVGEDLPGIEGVSAETLFVAVGEQLADPTPPVPFTSV